MTLILTSGLQDALANGLDDDINTGGGTAVIEFQTAGDVEVATIILQNPAFGAAVAGVITMAGQPITDASAAGNASAVEHFTIIDRAGADVLEGTVMTSGGDINITSLTIAATESVELTTFTITVPAS